jgi:hypothetical protein
MGDQYPGSPALGAGFEGGVCVAAGSAGPAGGSAVTTGSVEAGVFAGFGAGLVVVGFEGWVDVAAVGGSKGGSRGGTGGAALVSAGGAVAGVGGGEAVEALSGGAAVAVVPGAWFALDAVTT